MIKTRIIITALLIFLSGSLLNAQNIFDLESFKLGNFDNLQKYYTNSPQDRISGIVVNPVNSQYPASNFITDIILAGDTVWFSTGSGVMRTRDDFKTFDNYFGIAPFGEDDISGIDVRFNVVAVSTAVSQKISGENVPTGTGIKISTDYGLNWEAYPQPLDGVNDTTVIYGSNTLSALPVVVPQQNLAYDIAITRTENDTTNFTVWITTFAGGLRKTTDYGNTWQRVVLPPDNLDSIEITQTGYTFRLDPRVNLNQRGFTIEALNDSIIYVGTAGGINKSTDWGKSWRKHNYQNTSGNTNGNGIAGNFVVSMHIQRYGGNEILWGATRRADDNNEFNALSYTSNQGLTWGNTLSNIPPNGIGSLDSIVYGLTNEGLWRANFGEFIWAKAGTIVDEQTKDLITTKLFYAANHIQDTLYIGSSDGLLRTRELGQPWIGQWKVFRAVSPINLSSDIKTYAAPNPFAPDDERVRIFYKTTQNPSTITIKLFDFGMQPVRTVIQNATRMSTDVLFTQWDGNNDEGNQVANGVYFYRIQIDGDETVWGKILVLQ